MRRVRGLRGSRGEGLYGVSVPVSCGKDRALMQGLFCALCVYLHNLVRFLMGWMKYEVV